jgi:hypothetical protein
MTVQILADSLHPEGDRLVSFIAKFPRVILPQVLTHRAFSRNTASQRAIPLRRQIRETLADPYVPRTFASNRAGMSAGEPLSSTRQRLARATWYLAMYAAVAATVVLHLLGVHKQWAARLLFPFQHCRMLISSSMPGLENFLKLRDADDAQPEIADLARDLREALTASRPRPLAFGQAHLPFPTPGTLDLDTELMVNTARAARLSYDRVSGEGPASVEDDRRLFQKLLGGDSGKIHGSAFEHSAIVVPRQFSSGHRNFSPGWQQYRELAEFAYAGRGKAAP